MDSLEENELANIESLTPQNILRIHVQRELRRLRAERDRLQSEANDRLRLVEHKNKLIETYLRSLLLVPSEPVKDCPYEAHADDRQCQGAGGNR